MRPLPLSLATGAALALLLQTTGASAAELPDPQTPTVVEVLSDIDNALAGQGQTPAPLVGHQALTTDLPVTGSQPASATTAAGTLTMDVPADGADLTRDGDAVAVFDGSAPDTTVAVEGGPEGLRALLHIDSPEAPERFDFAIGGDVASLRLTADGGVDALDVDGRVVATAPAPWATDADGVPVPTHFEVNGTTLTQVVEHHAGAFAYGIVADPWWNPFSWDWGKIIRTTLSAIGNALKKCGVGALWGVLPAGIATGTTNFLLEKLSSTTARVWFGGVYGYVGIAVAGCIMANLQ